MLANYQLFWAQVNVLTHTAKVKIEPWQLDSIKTMQKEYAAEDTRELYDVKDEDGFRRHSLKRHFFPQEMDAGCANSGDIVADDSPIIEREKFKVQIGRY